MNNILIDTDVILDFFFDRKPFSDNAAKIFSLCEKNQINAFVTPVIISNVYYILRRTAKHQKVINELTGLLSITDVLIIDKKIILTAIKSNFKDFEDALQNFAAENEDNINVIVTRNVKDYKHSAIGVMTPENYLKTLIASH